MLGSLIAAERLAKRFGHVSALDGIDLAINPGEAVGLVGETGSGKSVTGELLLRLQQPTSGRVLWHGEDINSLRGPALRQFRRQAQIIFQDPFESLNPRFTVERALREPLLVHGLKSDAAAALRMVDLSPPERYLRRFPHELSGGERQRVAIARALVLEPTFLVADEPTSMLDVSIRAGILNLFRDLRHRLGLALLFISHDLSTVRHLCDRVVILYRGKVVEESPVDSLVANCRHPYTRALLAALPRVRGGGSAELPLVEPAGEATAGGCRFAPRCPYRMDVCIAVDPPLQDGVACHLYLAKEA